MYKKVLVVVAALALMFSAASVAISQQAPPAPNPKVVEMVAKAKAAVAKVNAQAVKAAIDSKEKAIFLDVRDPEEFAAGHLPGAVNVSRGTLEFNVFNKIPDQGAKIYVYCKTGGRAALAAKTLSDLGYKNVVLAEIVFADWAKASYPVER